MNEKEIRREKKAVKIFKNTALMAGIGVGLFVLSLIAPMIYQGEGTNEMQVMFRKYGAYIVAYVAAMVLTFMFMRKHIFVVNGIMQYVVLPTVAILFALDAYNIISGS